jgi:hypothetical protein
MAETKSENNTPETDDSSWESLLESINPESTKTAEKKPDGSATGIEVLKKWGFEKAIVETDCPQKKLQEIIDEHRARLDGKIRIWEEIYQSFRERFTTKISKEEQIISSWQQENYDYQTNLDLFETQKQQIQKELGEIRNRLYKIREELAIAKKDMVEKWMDEAEKEIQKAVAIQKMVYAETRTINKQRYEDEKSELALRIEQMKKMRLYFQERYDEVHKRLKRIGGEGINPFATYLLICLGTSAAGAAGFFFSVFTYNASFGNQDIFYYLLNGLMESSNTSTLSFLEKTAVLMIGFSIITVVSLGCNYLIQKLKKKDKDSRNEKFRQHFRTKFSYEGTAYFSQLKTGSWYTFWLNILPVLVLSGLIILVLSLNKASTQEVNALNSSNEGLVVGTVMALGLAAAMYLYILKIIEPRLIKRQDDEKGFHNWIKYNWELAVCIGLFILCTVSALFHYINQSKPGSTGNLTGQSASALAILLFIAVCFLAAFPIAYGVRLRGMIAIGQRLERNIYGLDDNIATCSGPEIPDVEIDYATKMQELINDLLAIIRHKALLLRGAAGDKLIPVLLAKEGEKSTPWFKNFSFVPFKNIFSNASKESVDSFYDLSKLAEWEKKYFPDHDERMKVIEAEYRDKEKELQEVNRNIDQLKTDALNKKLERDGELEKSYKRIDNWRLCVIDSLKSQTEKTEKIRTIFIEEQSDIMDGFHLGLWYRENQMGPVDNYFKSCVNFKMNGHDSQQPAKQ